MKIKMATVMVCVAGIAGAETRPEDAAGLFPYWDEMAVSRGALLYDENCSACHGANLQGEADWRSRNLDGSFRAPPHDATGHTWHHADEQLFAITKFGTEVVTGGAMATDMVGFQDVLSDDDILAVLAFIKSRWPQKIIARHNAMNRRLEAAQ
ncbi:c-type cytochrome [Marinovum sp. 2_MG-2023]|uniref:c-type cytochrome n=1 Tax=unclassified Marinovum TaxID=2647166 RepID=UPI0026E2BB0F|nr:MULTISPECIES: c-type cytochrome [unclassified Marinovum]MDO6732704.1 c-type cytochrome [Marinovum sp. 2_MG-2023]MDO6781980.1 c-type cytochrome [Marinovum sp. 1_MG-2023]